MFALCDCEAVYERTELPIMSWLEDTAESTVCGPELASRSGTRLPSFELDKNPTE